jgi:hypothetical protein
MTSKEEDSHKIAVQFLEQAFHWADYLAAKDEL